MSEIFTNRHGHKQVVEDEVELETPVVKPIAPPPVVARPQPTRRRRRQINFPWRWLLIGCGLILAFGLLTLEIVRLRYVSSVDGTRSSIQQIITNDVTPALKKQSLSSATIASFITKFEAASKSLCPGGLLDNFAAVYPRSKQAYDDCTAYRSHVESLITALGELQAESAYLEQLGPSLAPMIESLPDRFAVLAAQQENWKDLSSSLLQLSPPPAFQPTHKQLLERIKVVSDLWIELVAATNSQDSGRFVVARDKLPAAYADVRGSAEDFEAVLSATQAKLNTAYAQL